jgi:hypothetical protein
VWANVITLQQENNRLQDAVLIAEIYKFSEYTSCPFRISLNETTSSYPLFQHYHNVVKGEIPKLYTEDSVSWVLSEIWERI